MQTIAILGASGHGKVVADAALCAGWEKIVFYDDAWKTAKCDEEWKIVGDTCDLMLNASAYGGIIIAIGNNAIRLAKVHQFQEADISMATLIHPKAVVSRFATIGRGSVVFAGAVINPGAQLGQGCIINTNSTIDHDCVLGDAVHVSPGAHLSGHVHVGNLSWIGVGACVRQQIKIGSRVRIGAGAAVVKDIPDDCTAVGVPAKIL